MSDENNDELEETKERAEETITMCDELLEANPNAEEFATSVKEKVTAMLEWMTKNNRVTEKMISSIANMHSGTQKWHARLDNNA